MERTIANARDAIADGDTRQRGAIIEYLIANARDAIGEGDACEVRATAECSVSNHLGIGVNCVSAYVLVGDSNQNCVGICFIANVFAQFIFGVKRGIATTEGPRANARDAIADGDTRQRGAPIERSIANTRDAIGDDNRGNGSVIFERLLVNHLYGQAVVLLGNANTSGSACIANNLCIGTVSGNAIENALCCTNYHITRGANAVIIKCVPCFAVDSRTELAFEPMEAIIGSVSACKGMVSNRRLVANLYLATILTGFCIVTAGLAGCGSCYCCKVVVLVCTIFPLDVVAIRTNSVVKFLFAIGFAIIIKFPFTVRMYVGNFYFILCLNAIDSNITIDYRNFGLGVYLVLCFDAVDNNVAIDNRDCGFGVYLVFGLDTIYNQVVIIAHKNAILCVDFVRGFVAVDNNVTVFINRNNVGGGFRFGLVLAGCKNKNHCECQQSKC